MPDQKGQFSLKLIQKCPVCAREYAENKIDILEENDFGFLAYITCSACASSIIVRVMTMPHGLIGNAILTDLSHAEVLNYGNSEESVLSDHVLAIHELIDQDSNGFFIENLKKFNY